MTYERPGKIESAMRDVIAPVEEIIEAAREGRMFILVDHEDRENEGDLVIPASCANAAAINFMATHGRGLICLTLPPERVAELGLPMMAVNNSSRHETAFTVSIEAREGITTGISAADRARTIATAIDPQKCGVDLATPGHVFPLRARKGGVLERAGHTEAGCDVARLAGHYPASVICEIMKDDGNMARLPDLVEFAHIHDLKIGAISDLITYRRRFDNLVRETDHRVVHSQFGGSWTMRIFTDVVYGVEHVALVKGDINGPEPVLVRPHALNESADVLGLGPKRANELSRAMEIIAEEGRGVICLFRQPHKALFHPEEDGSHTIRHIGLGAQILVTLGLRQLILLTDNPLKRIIGLEAYNLEICATRQIFGDES